jgi:hypothetical protein
VHRAPLGEAMGGRQGDAAHVPGIALGQDFNDDPTFPCQRGAASRSAADAGRT